MAIVAGAFVYSTMTLGLTSLSVGTTTVQDSCIAVTSSSFTNCESVSFTGGPALGTASVYGGALSLLHSPQVSTFVGTAFQPAQALQLVGFNVTFSISSSSFTACSALTNSASVLPGATSGGGGAVYASSIAFASVILQSLSFSSCSVTVATVAIGFPASSSSGGGVLVDIPSGSTVTNASVLLSSNTFWNCSANGAGQYSPFMAVRGGGVAVSRAAAIKVSNTRFSACSIAGASGVSVVSGGAGLSAVLVASVSLTGCMFDGAASQDSSGTSAGLLVLPSGAAPAHIAIDTCSFSSMAIVSLNVTCVDAATGFNSAACVQPGPAFSASNSNISQLAPAFANIAGSGFSIVGSVMLSLQQNVSVTSSNSLLVCNSTQFAVFRKLLFDNVVYSCSPCPALKVSLTSNVTLLETASAAPSSLIDQCKSLSYNPSTLSCPFGVDFCSTTLKLTSGFWANFTNAGDALNRVFRCPQGYCGCGSESPSCLLYPPLSLYYRTDDALCNGNRRGVLCGGCKTNFTQSLDGVTCISNDECANNVGWTWAVTVIGYAVYAVYTVLTSLQQDDGLITSMLFYGQMSLFASYQRLKTSVPDASQSSSAASSWAARVTQFESITSSYSKTCYGKDMGAYAVTAAQLSGPAIVLVLSVAITLVLKRAQSFMQQRNINVKVSVSATLSTVTLLLFSSVTTITFKLITCPKDLDVIFIDGTEPCYDAKWKGLVAVVVILCLFPVLFAAALRWKRLPLKIQTIVCSAYSESTYYWGAVTLAFRLVMSVVYASVREFPSIAALVQTALCFAMLMMLMHLKPYRHSFTYYFDVLCHVCLAIQFVLEVLVRSTESLGISIPSDNNFSKSLDNAYEASFALRYVHAPRMHQSPEHLRFIYTLSPHTLQVCSLRGLRDNIDLPETCSCRPHHILCVSLPQKHGVDVRPATEERLFVRVSIPHKHNVFVLAASQETRVAQAHSIC